MHKIIDSIKYIKAKDLLAPFIFLAAIIPALIYKLILSVRKKPLWLICEDGNTARDNGYYFYKYIVEKHPEVNCRYVIRKQSTDYEKIKKIDRKIVQPFSLSHYVMYLAAKWNISNHKHGNPNQPLFYIIHVGLGLIKNRVFLQHGVTKDDSPWIYYKNTKFKYFICGAKREYDFVKEKFGYPVDSVVFTGFPRFDTLIDNSKDKKQLLIMPTWRNWLGRETNSLQREIDFKETNYYKNWNGLLNNKDFLRYIEKNDIYVLFYPHQHMQRYLKDFIIQSKNIKVADMSQDIQDALRDSYLLITDYSSVYMDFAYMRKPVIYYQFDYDEYRKKQLSEGYFDYERDGFGPVCREQRSLIVAIKKKIPADYSRREDAFFNLKDERNSERVFHLLEGKNRGHK